MKKLVLVLSILGILGVAFLLPAFAQTDSKPVPQLYTTTIEPVQIGSGTIQSDTDDAYYSGSEGDTASLAAFGLFGMSMFIFYAFFMCMYCMIIVIALAEFVLKIISLVHCLENAPEKDKTLWVVLIVLVPIMGTIYFFTKRKVWVKGQEIEG